MNPGAGGSAPQEAEPGLERVPTGTLYLATKMGLVTTSE